MKRYLSVEMIRVWIFVVSLNLCDAAIYHINDTEYQRMPPLWSLDEYESCLIEEGSTYCMLQLKLYAKPGNELMHMIINYSNVTMKHYDHKVINRGVCVKKTCNNYIDNSTTTEGQRFFLEVCLNDSLRREYGLNAKVSKLYYCDQHNESVIFDAWDWTVLEVILGLVTLNIIGTLYDYHLIRNKGRGTKKGNVFLLSFSVMQNWKQLIDMETNSSKLKDLQYLNGARVILNLCTILVHSMMIFTVGFSQNSQYIEKTFDLPSYYILNNGLVVVQIFFFISGFLKSYDFNFNDEKRTLTIRDFPKTVLLRISRFMPALAVTLALATSWVRHTGSGPLWKLYVTDSLVADCRACWWHHLLFINNYVQGGKYCLMPTWHLAADMQVFVVGVSAFLVSRRLLLPVLLLSALAPAVHTILQDLDPVIATPQFLRTWDSHSFWLLNVLGHNSLPCFVIGMITGSRVYEWRKKGKHLVISWWWSLMQYVSIGLIPALLFSWNTFYADGERTGIMARAVYNSAIRVLLGLTCVLVTYAFINKSTSFLKRLFEWRCWTVASRVTYCVFLLHMMLVHVMMGSRTRLSCYSFSNVMHAMCVVVVVSYLLSVPLYLMVEAPLTKLSKHLVHSPIAKYKEYKDK